MVRFAGDRHASNRTGLFTSGRPPVWCSVPAALGVLAMGYLVLVCLGLSAVSITMAAGLLFIGLMMIGIRFLIYLKGAEPQYWDELRLPPGCCRKCGYNLTGNVSGVCPECGVNLSRRDSA